jgi:hypothetical protein
MRTTSPTEKCLQLVAGQDLRHALLSQFKGTFHFLRLADSEDEYAQAHRNSNHCVSHGMLSSMRGLRD